MTWEKIENNILQCKENRKKYKVILYFGRDSKGKMKKSSKVIEGTLTEARNILKLHEADRVKKVVNISTQKTLKQVFTDWNTIGGGFDNEDTTKTSNENIERHIIEYFGDIKVSKITVTAIREYMAYLKNEKELSNNTINKHRTRLNTIFNFMITVPEEYGIYTNPIEKVKPYKVAEFNNEIYEPEEAKELLLSLRNSDRHDFEVAINLAFWCGCRREETCALKWENVNFDKGFIKICEVRTTAKGQVFERSYTKNKEIRVVGITPWLEKILKDEFEYQQLMKSVMDKEYNDNDYVFCHDDGTPWHPNSLSNEYRKYLVKNGFKVIRYHDLRHTNASLLLTMLGVVEVAHILGHKKPSTTTDIYGHVFNKTITKGASVLENIMEM